MQRLLGFFCLLVSFALLPLGARASPVTASFSGQVASYGFNPAIAAFYPIGTAVAFTLSFDDAGGDGRIGYPDAIGTPSGSMTVGGDSFNLDQGSWAGASFDANGLTSSMMQVTGQGPTYNGTDYFFGLFVLLAPDMTLAGPVSVGYGFPIGNGFTAFSYAQATGSFSTRRGVPEPGTAALMLAGLGFIVARRSRRDRR